MEMEPNRGADDRQPRTRRKSIDILRFSSLSFPLGIQISPSLASILRTARPPSTSAMQTNKASVTNFCPSSMSTSAVPFLKQHALLRPPPGTPLTIHTYILRATRPSPFARQTKKTGPWPLSFKHFNIRYLFSPSASLSTWHNERSIAFLCPSSSSSSALFWANQRKTNRWAPSVLQAS